MAQLTDQQIASAARSAGFTGNAVGVAVAVALAESNGETTARNVNSNGSIDLGLWQINSVHAALIAGRNLTDPAVNAQLAFQISNRGTNWRPWSAYKSGSSQKFSARAATAAGLPNVDFGAGIVSASNTTGGGSGADVSYFTNPGMWARLGCYLLGGLMLLFGLWQLSGAGLPIPGIGQAGAILKKVRKVT